MVSKLKEGDLAPEFEADSTEGKVSLDSFKGKNLVLYFYLRDMTFGCTIQAKEFTINYSEFKKLDTVVVGVSRDNLSSHLRFCEQEGIVFPLISDIDGKICNSYESIDKRTTIGFQGITRTTFLIGKDKKILRVWSRFKPLGHAKTVLQATRWIST